MNRFTHYVDELQHPQQRYHHGKPSEATIYAGIIGIGCAIGLRRMMRISHGINEEELEHADLDGGAAIVQRVEAARQDLDEGEAQQADGEEDDHDAVVRDGLVHESQDSADAIEKDLERRAQGIRPHNLHHGATTPSLAAEEPLSPACMVLSYTTPGG